MGINQDWLRDSDWVSCSNWKLEYLEVAINLIVYSPHTGTAVHNRCIDHELLWGLSADQTLGAVLSRWQVHCQLLTVPTGDPWDDNTSNCQPPHLPWPCAISPVVRRLTLPHVWHVQERDCSGTRVKIVVTERLTTTCTTTQLQTVVFPWTSTH